MTSGSARTWTVAGNGMRVIELPVAGRLATSISIAFAAGSRHEHPGEVGVAHLLEHVAFKGTAGWPTARELNRSAERLGTSLDASTGEDYVEFSSLVRAESAMGACELLAEVCGRPLLEAAAVEAERAVVCQEIADDDEDPATAADDRMAAALFPGHRLAVRITGRAADVERLSHADLIGFRERQWSPRDGAVVVAGNLDHVERGRVEELVLGLPGRPSPPPAPAIPAFAPRIEVEQRDSEVVHLRVGYHVAGYDLSQARERAAAEVYSQLLGGPLGSRLGDALREERGICYAVDGYVWGYPGVAGVAVSLSLQASRLGEAYELIEAIMADLRAKGPTAEEADRARAYATGMVALSFDTVGGRAGHALETLMDYGDEDVDPMSYLRAIESVTPAALADLAGRVDRRPCIGASGPVEAGAFGLQTSSS